MPFTFDYSSLRVGTCFGDTPLDSEPYGVQREESICEFPIKNLPWFLNESVDCIDLVIVLYAYIFDFVEPTYEYQLLEKSPILDVLGLLLNLRTDFEDEDGDGGYKSLKVPSIID